ncbi:MAG TPA: sigma-70 family RNA polymerase sigma factor [Baekduia sp.]|nr:sigma-70 family RNA polymerase sigma factor [Baekduia sp.]
MTSDRPPFQRFLDRTRDDVWRFCVAAAGANNAEDCFQETYMAALRAYPKVRSGSNLHAWVLTIAHNKAMDIHRASARRPQTSGELPDIPVTDGHRDEDLWAQVRALPQKQSAAILLRYVADLPHKEVAAALGCSEEAARRSAFEGLQKLRTEVTR